MQVGKMLNRIFPLVAVAIILSLIFIAYMYYYLLLNYNIPAYFRSKNDEKVLQQFVKFPIKIDNKVESFVYQLYQQVEGGNSALILNKKCKKVKSNPESNRIELVTGFVDLSHPHYQRMLGDLTRISNRPENETIQARLMEIINVLQLNLLHDMVETVHVLVWRRETALYLKSFDLKNSERLVLRVVGKEVGLKEQLDYASKCLNDRVIAITNQDITIGKGWDNANYTRILKARKIIYALTSHSIATEKPKHGNNCTWTHKLLNNCGSGGDYKESHGTFIFQMRNWTSSQLKEMTALTPSKIDMKDMIIWYFDSRMNYTILNPCQTLFVHHHHCVPIRSLKTPGVINGEKSSTIEFTDKLQ